MPYVDLDSIHVPSAGNRPPFTWGTTVNANMDYIFDEVLAKLGAFTSYTPVVTQSGAVTKTVTYAKCVKIGRNCTGAVDLIMTGAGTANNAITVSMPFPAAIAGSGVSGSGFVYDATAGLFYPGNLLNSSTTTWALLPSDIQSGGQVIGATGSTMTAALATNDVIRFHFHYETAT